MGYLNKVLVGLDISSSEFKVNDKNKKNIDFKTPRSTGDDSKLLIGDKLIALYNDLIKSHPIVSITDYLDKDDWSN